MRKNIKTYIYVVTAILPIVLSACSNKTDDTNTLKAERKSTTTFANGTSSNITDTTEKITTVKTTEEDTTELISETEQEVINSTEDTTKYQETQAEVQQTTIVTSVNSTPAPVQTTPRPTETDQTTPGPITPDRPDRPDRPDTPELYKIKEVIGLNEKYTYNGIEFIINNFCYDGVTYSGGNLYISIVDETILNIVDWSNCPKLYFKYDVYDSNGICVKTNSCSFELGQNTKHIDISDLPSTGYTIKLSNYQ